jgi:quercetin dioxygenase-like cupin family protein
MDPYEPIGYKELELIPEASRTSDDVRWSAGYFAYGGAGAEHSTSLYYEIPPGKRLGRHSNNAEETQFFIGGRGIYVTEDASLPVGPGDLLVVREGEVHDILSNGPDPLRAVAFFAKPTIEHHWTEDEWESGGGQVTGTPNRG